MDEQSIENQIKLLITSQKSLGDNIEKLYETVTAQIAEHQRERRAILAAIRSYLQEGESE